MCRRTLTAKSWPVGTAIIRGTEPRATSRDARSSRLRSNGVMCYLLCAVGIRRIPISYPFPDISNHVIETQRISSKKSDRRRVEETIGQFIFLRPLALPDVGTAIFGRIRPAGRHSVHVGSCRILRFAWILQFGAPRRSGNIACNIFGSGYLINCRLKRQGRRNTTAGRYLPLCFRWQPFTCPLRVGVRVVPGDQHHRMIHCVFNRAARTPNGCRQSAPLTYFQSRSPPR